MKIWAVLFLGVTNIMHKVYNIIYLLYIFISTVRYCLRTNLWKCSQKISLKMLLETFFFWSKLLENFNEGFSQGFSVYIKFKF